MDGWRRSIAWSSQIGSGNFEFRTTRSLFHLENARLRFIRLGFLLGVLADRRGIDIGIDGRCRKRQEEILITALFTASRGLPLGNVRPGRGDLKFRVNNERSTPGSSHALGFVSVVSCYDIFVNSYRNDVVSERPTLGLASRVQNNLLRVPS